ncbi:hypothetical protein [Micromonospora sp. NPDC023814]|uniref:hypothetical protein n=1 Tax=Micromonospora sp. NPDC023814 TaxID=3154596 RepID=UPI0034023524
MSDYAEYAALARQLAERRRAGERGAAAEAERRRNLHAAAEYLQHRLTAQGQRLDQLGQAIGIPASGVPAAPAPAPAAAPAGPVTGPAGDGASGGAGPGAGEPAGAAGAPGRPGVGAYPQVGVGETKLALPPGAAPAAGGVPGPRPAETDPSTELELARRYADESDRHGQQAEVLAQRPALLPTWSPVARALAVYAGCAAVAAVLMVVMVLASGVGLVDGFTLGAWICAGLPALSFFAGYLVLGRWGRPAMVAGTPPRYVHLGFLICFVAVPVAYVAYLLLFRLLR